jgi:2-oxoglutarate ferredoxin oxidoreductase subunit delta
MKSSNEANNRSTGGDSRKAYDIDIFRAWCKACGICAAFCPRECIGRDEEGAPFVIDAERCTGCGWCELHCPDFAISVRPRKGRKAQEEN